jgi:hypothetical protein
MSGVLDAAQGFLPDENCFNIEVYHPARGTSSGNSSSAA